jgi:hypothetical protein
MSDGYDLDMLAARSAIALWFGDEGQRALQIQKAPLDLELLKRWLSTWGVARNAPTKPALAREDLRVFLNDVAKPALDLAHQSGHEVYRLVETLSQQVEPICKCRPTSLISKFAFSCYPTMYVPYDSTARKGLSNLGHQIPGHAYVLYVRAFHAEKTKIVE